MKSFHPILLKTGLFASLSLFSSVVLAQERDHILLQRNLTTGKDSVDQSFEPPNVPYDTIKAETNWFRIKKDLSEKEVTGLLGSPSKHRFDYENALDYWFYGQRVVVFTTIDKKVWLGDK